MLFLVPNRQNVHQLSICHNACFQSGSFPLPSLSQTQGSGGKKTADFLQFRHEALSSVACPIPLSLIHGPIYPNRPPVGTPGLITQISHQSHQWSICPILPPGGALKQDLKGLARYALWPHLLQCWPAFCKPHQTQ